MRRRFMGSAARLGRTIGLTSVASAAMMTPASAQQAAPATSPEATEEANSSEVVVTAQRREQRLSDVPTSVSVVSNEFIEATSIQNVSDLGAYIPNVTFTRGSGLSAAVSIRGVGASSRNIGFDSRVGVYIDGVYLGQSPGLDQQLLDLERVEVLRGPQGALFGKNTIAGAINLITRKPSEEFEARGTVRVGNYDDRSGSAIVNVPVTDDLAIKGSVGRDKRDGFIRNIFNGTTTGNQDSWAYRGQLRWRPLNDLIVDLSVDGLTGRENGNIGNVVTNPLSTALDTAAPGRRDLSANSPLISYRDLLGASLELNHALGDGSNLRSQTSYRRTKLRFETDVDYSPADLLSVDYTDIYRQWTQELQLTSPGGRRFEYVVGLFFYRLDSTTRRDLFTGADAATVNIPPNRLLPSGGDLLTRNAAIYGKASYELVDRLKLAVGFRAMYEKMAVDWSINGSTVPTVGIATGVVNQKRNDHDFSPSATLTYEITPDFSAYARYAEGFKSGGYNLDYVTTNALAAGVEFDSETAKNYEVGLKGALGRAIDFSVTGFITDYSNYQVNQFRNLGGGRTAIVIGNAASVRTKGLELETTFRPYRGLSMGMGIGVLDAKFSSYPNVDRTGLDVTGKRLPGAARFQGTYRIAYETALGNSGLTMRANANYTRLGPYFTQITNITTLRLGNGTTIPFGQVPIYDFADARLTLIGRDDRWELAGYAKNFTNNTYVTGYGRDFLGTVTENLGDPRTYGLELTVKF